jgi:ADP-heptose:LPS heptosyltransferase
VEILAAAGLSAAAPVVALHPGASKPPRGWHARRFAALARGLCEREGAAILLIGGAGERPLLEAVGSTVPPGRLLLPPPDASIKVVGALLERCHLFVGNDSGPMHIAAALGTPTVAIFGPGSPLRTAPHGTAGRVIAVTRAYPCSPCRQDFFRECPPSPAGKPFCLEEIDVEEVREAALSLLGSPRAKA